MSNRKAIRSKQQSRAALELEKSGDQNGVLKLYQRAAKADPLNTQAWNRQMILYRKSKSRQEEITLIRAAITEYKKQIEINHNDWLKENQTKADSSRELAQVLGLLEENGQPMSNDATLEKWETRLYLLEYRLKNARTKKPKASKKPVPAKAAPKDEPKTVTTKPKTSKNRPADKTKAN